MLSRLTFWWVQPLMVLGYKVKVELDDLLPLPQSLRMDSVGPAFYSTLQSLPARYESERHVHGGPQKRKGKKGKNGGGERSQNKQREEFERIQQSQQRTSHSTWSPKPLSFLFLSFPFFLF
jgi:hypothetical protein